MPQMPQAKHIWVRSAAIRSMNQQENSVLPPFCIIGVARSISFCDHLLFFYRNTPMLASGIKGIRVQLRDLIRSE
jgi:hypothetical protein